MTTKQNECVHVSDHVIAIDHDVTRGIINISSNVIHIILSVDEEHLQGYNYPIVTDILMLLFTMVGLVATMNSLLKHSSNPQLLYFHIVIAGQPIKLLESYLQCHVLLLPGQVEVKQLNSDWLDGQITVRSSKQLVGNLASQANFARFFFHR